MNRRVLAWILLLLFVGGVVLVVLSFALRRNGLALPGLMLALPVVLVLYLVKPFGELPTERKREGNPRQSNAEKTGLDERQEH